MMLFSGGVFSFWFPELNSKFQIQDSKVTKAESEIPKPDSKVPKLESKGQARIRNPRARV
jgi:hypothetical protein